MGIEKSEPLEDSLKTLLAALSRLVTDKTRPRLGVVQSEEQGGKMVDAFNKQLQESMPNATKVDISEAVAALLSEVRPQDLPLKEAATQVLSLAFNECFKTLTEAIENHSSITQAELSKKMVETFEAKRQEFCSAAGTDDSFLELAHDPFIQSGSKQLLKQVGASTQEKLEATSITLSLIVKYFDMHCQTTRSYFVNPTKEETACYKLV